MAAGSCGATVQPPPGMCSSGSNEGRRTTFPDRVEGRAFLPGLGRGSVLLQRLPASSNDPQARLGRPWQQFILSPLLLIGMAGPAGSAEVLMALLPRGGKPAPPGEGSADTRKMRPRFFSVCYARGSLNSRSEELSGPERTPPKPLMYMPDLA